MGNRVTFIYEALDRYSATARKISRQTHKMRRNFQKITISIIRFSRKLKETGKALVGFGRKISGVGGELTTKLTLPILALGTAALVQSSKLEQLGVSFEVMLGSAAKAKGMMKDLVNFAAKTPFQLEGIAIATKQLLAFGVKQKDIIPTLKNLGNIAAGTGKPLTEFSLIFGKILGKGKVGGEELMQLAEKGVALQTILAKKFRTTPAEIVKAVSKGQISFTHFKEAMASLTAEGGKFQNLMERMSSTLGGLWSTFGDAIKIALSEIGNILVKELDLKQLLIDTILFIEKLTIGITKFTKQHPALTKIILAVVGLVALLGPLVFMVAQVVLVFGALSIVSGILGTTTLAMLWPILAIIAAISLLVVAGVMWWARWNDIVGGFKFLMQDLSNFVTGIWDGMMIGIANIIDGIIAKILSFISFITSVSSNPFTALGEMAFNAAMDFNSSSKTDINVNMNAPKGVINNIQSATTGKPQGLNVGVNMARAL